MRNKGKVHPSPSCSSSSSSSVSSPNNDAVLSVLKLLPAAILAIASVLSLQDREVLAYMITRSMKATNPSIFLEEKSRKNSKKSSSNGNNSHSKSPSFDCECFDCYTSYWFRWDSSPNRELIHQVIEAFEEHLSLGEQSKKGKNKKKDKISRRGGTEKKMVAGNESPPEIIAEEITSPVQSLPENEAFPPEITENSQITSTVEEEKEVTAAVAVVEQPEKEEKVVVVSGAAAGTSNHHKGLARKVLPDVLGLLNSRLWSLWSPNV